MTSSSVLTLVSLTERPDPRELRVGDIIRIFGRNHMIALEPKLVKPGVGQPFVRVSCLDSDRSHLRQFTFTVDRWRASDDFVILFRYRP